MKIRLDAVIADIAAHIDNEILEHHSEFAALPRFNRLHFILRSLARCDLARAERSSGRKVVRWRLSDRLKECVGLKPRGIPDEFERIERPITISTLADEFDEILRTLDNAIEETASAVLRRFAMYEIGLLEYRGKKDGLCRFYKSSKRLLVENEDGNAADFVDNYVV
jgi:hypothetical protein